MYLKSIKVIFLYPSINNGARELPNESLKTISSLFVVALLFSIVIKGFAPERNISYGHSLKS